MLANSIKRITPKKSKEVTAAMHKSFSDAPSARTTVATTIFIEDYIEDYFLSWHTQTCFCNMGVVQRIRAVSGVREFSHLTAA